ncbi:formate-dependent phosphoribosylglycinamide formyltransferase [Candidatus Woesearchaeota archaeon]|nr:formate-dependent phosphoribosylglycinamide formyltransferase [Candidatus Woesearchaeota archaeon]
MKGNELFSPLTKKATKILLLGAGELGREVIIEAMRLGIETVAVDRYLNAPGQQVAHRAYTGNMKDAGFVRAIIEREKPDAIIPEIEAINLDLLFELEKEGFNVIPNAFATHAAMQRERIRDVIAKKAGVPTSKYLYANTLEELEEACEKIGYPCWVKAIMSSSGHGSSFVESKKDVKKAYENSVRNARGAGDRMIVEQHIPFDIEVTELAVRHYDDNGKVITSFPKPVGHYQIDGDYHSSWQPAEVSEKVEKDIYRAAEKITSALGGVGLFGCELFVKDGKVYGNECSPRPHDTGMVTLATHQSGYSECGLHVRAVCGLPVPSVKDGEFNVIPPLKPGASHVILSPCDGWVPGMRNLRKAMGNDISLFIFGKPEAHINRRMGVVVALADKVEDAKKKAEKAAHYIEIQTQQQKWLPQQEKRMHLT